MTSPPLLDRLSPDDRRTFIQRAVRRRYRPGETVFHEGDPGQTLHVIAKGRAMVYVVTPQGDSAALAVLGPGQCFGELAIIRDGTRTASVVAVDALETLTLQQATLAELPGNYVIQRYLIEALAEQVGRLTTRVLDAHFASAEQRVVRRLREAMRLFADSPDGAVDVVPLTQQQLADLAGTTRPTVNRVLRELEEDGTIALGRGRVVILDMARLERRAR